MSDFTIVKRVLKKYTGSGGDVVIPENVTSIGEAAFFRCSSLTSVVIPDSVTSIGDRAFCYCSSLKSIVIPDSVTNIGGGAFYDCRSLTSIVVPDSVTSIGSGAFGSRTSEPLVLVVENLKLRPDMFASGAHILPKNISSLPVSHRAQGAVDYAEDERFKDVDRASYLKYIKSNAVKLVDQAMMHPALLALMCSEKLITAKNLESYIEAAQKTGNAELIALMLDYNTTISEKAKAKVVKVKEKQDEEVFDRMVQRQNKVGIEGLKFVVTGELKTFKKRSDLKEFIESKGAKLVGSMSSKVD